MERHKITQSHANGTTMGRFPRLTPVRLSPQVPDHMTVSVLLWLEDAEWGNFFEVIPTDSCKGDSNAILLPTMIDVISTE